MGRRRGAAEVVREGLWQIRNREQNGGWIDNLIIHFQGTTSTGSLANNGMQGYSNSVSSIK